MRLAALAALLPGLPGCAAIGMAYGTETAYNAAFRERIIDGSALSAEGMRRLQEVRFIDSPSGIEGTPKGEVVGFACKLTPAVFVFKWVWKPALNETNGLTPEEAARTQLRILAMHQGANAVVAPSCTHQEGVDWGNNCFESWRCSGQAYALP